MSADSFKILDKNGAEMPDHHSGRRRSYKEAKALLDRLNKNGEYAPYRMVNTTDNSQCPTTA